VVLEQYTRMCVTARAFGRTDAPTSRSVQCTDDMFRTYLDATDHQIPQTSSESRCQHMFFRSHNPLAFCLQSSTDKPSYESVQGTEIRRLNPFFTFSAWEIGHPAVLNIAYDTQLFAHLYINWIYTVAYRPVTKRELCKQRPFLGNGSVNTFRGKEYARNNSYYW
jgi:hypothetical protein